MMKHMLCPCTLAGLLCMGQSTFAVDLGQFDDFQDGTTQNWRTNLLGQGGGPPPTNIPNGGPLGSGDAYLQLTSTGTQSAGGRMVVLNVVQWSGDYTAAGVTLLRMDVNNLGQTNLSLRILFEDPMGGPPTNIACSTIPVFVPAGSGWVSAMFPIAATDLTALEGDAATVLANTTLLRIYHSDTVAFPGAPIAAQLGLDNITAVPEPAGALVMALGLAALGARKRRRK